VAKLKDRIEALERRVGRKRAAHEKLAARAERAQRRVRELAAALHEAEKALGEAGITVNKNAIPFDTNPPMKPSGIRIGSPAMTTRGMKEAEMSQIGRWIAEVLEHRTDSAMLSKVKKQVLELCEAFPLYADRRAKAQAEVKA